MIHRISAAQFTWDIWRAGSISEFHIPCREECIIKASEILRKYAVGYCDGGQLLCRPKTGEMAVMFFYNNEHFWFHLRKKEFKEVFNEEIFSSGV